MRLSYEELLERALKRVKKSEEKKRFEMPKAVIEKIGQRTLIRNFSKIAEIFRRDEKHISKYLFKQLATTGNLKEGMLVLQGNLQPAIIQKKVEEYAKKYVICKECGSADTRLIKEGRITFLRCEACGARKPV